MDFSIRLASREDASAIAGLNEVVQQLHHDERPDWFKPPNASTFRPTVEGWLASPEVVVFVADSAEGLLGYAVGARHERPESALTYGATFVELDQVVVVGSVRGHGIGRALCTAVIDWARGEGVSRVELGTWPFNDTAYGLFSSLDFSTTVRRMSRSLHQ